MTSSGLWIDLKDLSTYSPAFQAEIKSRWFGPPETAQLNAVDAGGDPDVPPLAVWQAEALLEGSSSPSVIDTLREVVRLRGEFTYDEVVDRLNLNSEDMRGAWSAITKLVRSVTSNKRARLMKWKKRDNVWHASVPAASVESLRAALANY